MNRRRLFRFGAATVAFATVALASAPAWADTITVRKVDTTQYPHVTASVLVSGATPTANAFAVRENGVIISKLTVRPLSQTAQPVGTVLAIDCSGSMKSKGAIDAAKAAARGFVSSKAANDSVAVICFADTPVVVTEFTSDTAALLAAIDKVHTAGETALWDALVKSASMYSSHPDLQANVVLLSDGGDTKSQAGQDQAVNALRSVHAAVFAIGIESSEFNPNRLQSLVDGSGGTLLTTPDPRALAQQFASVRRAIANQYEVAYDSPGTGGPLTIALSAGDLQTVAETRAGTKVVSPKPTPVKLTNPGVLAGSRGKLIVLVLITASVALFAYAVMIIMFRERSHIANRLRTYAGPEDDTASFVESGLIGRAVEVTGRLAGDSGLLTKIAGMLEQANIALRPAEALFFYVVGVVLLGLLAIVGAPSFLVAAVCIGVVAVAPIGLLKRMQSRRLRKFESQLPDTLQLLGGSLRAGYSLLQGFEVVSQETPEPMGRELRRVLAEARLGRSLEDALADTAQRMQSRDFEWAVMAIRIQREVGGNLAELLQTVAETMTSRERIRREIKSLTAEGRISALVMGILPVGLAGFLFAVSPDYIGTLFSSGAGLVAVIGSALLAGGGIVWLQKIIKIEV